MKLVTWYDDDGFLRQVTARDGDSETEARETGIKHEPPDLSELDWVDVQRKLHNLLVERGLNTWADVQDAQGAYTNAIQVVVRPKITALYRSKN